jgi:hypothetical protein
MEQKLASLLEPSREKKLKGEATPSLPLKCPWLFHLITFFHYHHYQTLRREGEIKMARKSFRKHSIKTVTTTFT